MSTQTADFGTLSPTLAVGFRGSHTLKLRPWKGDAERALAALRDAKRELIKKQPMMHLSAILATLVVEFGGKTLWACKDGSWEPEMKDDERLFLFDEAYLPDIQMAFFFVRRAAYGSEFKFKTRLPGDDEPTMIKVLLDEFPATIVEGIEDCRVEHDFGRDVQFRGGTARSCVLGPPRWSAITALKSTNAAALGYAAIYSSVHDIPGARIRAPKASDFDDLDRLEIERLTEATDKASVGLDLSVTVDLDGGGTHKTTVQWLDPDFFTGSSLTASYTRSGKTSSRSSTSEGSVKMSGE